MTSSTGRPLEEFSMAFVTAPSQEKAQELAQGIVRQGVPGLLPSVLDLY